MTDLDAIKQRVKDGADLPAWVRRDGLHVTGGPVEFKTLCPFHEDKHPSLTLYRKEPDGWRFKCFSCDASGDIFEWVMRRQSLDFPRALRLVAGHLGISVPEPRVHQPRDVREAGNAGGEPAPAAGAERPAPFDPKKFTPLEGGSAAHRYLVEQRGLPEPLLAAYSVGQTADGLAYAFAYKWQPPGRRHPVFEFCKVVKVERVDGKKVEWREPRGGRNILFGMLAVPATATRLVITEGELDAISWAHYAQAHGRGEVLGAVSVPGGAGYLGWLDVCWDWLEKFERIHISFDEDRAGQAKIHEIVKRLGIVRTDIVRLPEREVVA